MFALLLVLSWLVLLGVRWMSLYEDSLWPWKGLSRVLLRFLYYVGCYVLSDGEVGAP